jgi:aryl-alcohol dehydrogenase-like predicted oxidoreductase
MEYVTPAGTDLELPRLVMGTMTFGGQVDRDGARAMVERCREHGITMFDTANSYNAGASERILGEIVAPYRDEVLIASKVFNPTGDESTYRGLGRAAVRQSLEDSLRRRGTDHLDVYYLHAPDWETPIEETLSAMADAVAAGKVRHVAVSNYAAWQVAEIRCLSDRNGWPTVGISQPMYNLLARRLDDEYAAFSARYDMHNIVYNPLAGGLLTGKHTDPGRPGHEGRFAAGSRMGEMYRRRYWNDQQFAAVEALRKVAADGGLTLLQLAFRWLWSRPLVDGILLGASSLEQLEANLEAADGPPVTAELAEACDEVWSGLRGAAPLYNR